MFVVLVGSVLTTGLFVQALLGKGEAPAWFIFAVSLWLWFTVLFANFAEAMAEGRGKAQAESLRKARRDITAKKLADAPGRGFDPGSARYTDTTSAFLRKGDLVLIAAGEFIPSDGEIVDGIASVDEDAITGEALR
jgi:K+-transporting ATPase ATPase B chain